MKYPAVRPESVGNAVSNVAYGLAAIPYGVLAYQGVCVFTAINAVFGLFVLCVGSWVYHANANRYTNLCDHIGMHAALSAVAGFAIDYGWNAPNGIVVALALFASGLISLHIWGIFSNTFTTKHSRKMIMVHALVIFVGLIGFGFVETMMTIGVFVMAFMFHHDHENTPTRFGPIHAAWHAVSALGLALPAIWALNL